jgi:hypothetical protein
MFEETLIKISNFLSALSIPYMIIGGQAVLLYGEPRLTRDIDITLGIDIDKLELVLKNLSLYNLKPLPENPTEFVNKTYVLPVEDLDLKIRVDFIFSQTPYERQAINKANKVIIKDKVISFATVEDLLIHKIFAGRARDIEDARIIYLKNPDIDTKYIEKWLKEFDNALEVKNFLVEFKRLIEGTN